VRSENFKRLSRGAVGFILGLTIWVGFTPLYNLPVAGAAEWLIRASERRPVTRFQMKGREVLVLRADVPPGSSRPGIPLYDLTFNFILLTTLFAANERSWGDRNIRAFVLSAVIMFPLHVLALIAWVKDLYASSFGPISAREYGETARFFWGLAVIFYRLVGQFALPLMTWWALRPEGVGQGESRKPTPHARRA
jgi:hypothetical protein